MPAIRDKLRPALGADDVAAALTGLAERGLVFLDGPFALALALPATRNR